jgi:hypothetical protein
VLKSEITPLAPPSFGSAVNQASFLGDFEIETTFGFTGASSFAEALCSGINSC